MIFRLLGITLGLAFLALSVGQWPQLRDSARPARAIIGQLWQIFIAGSLLIYGLGGQKRLDRYLPFFRPKWWKRQEP
ncbi:hypothetical protein [Chitinibacter sp. GC72]|uniref:hypothetical protein n=1 Tax=Chitinibacter sp. GC72 TaxID=1526917 RepID=UPI0012FB08D0|nr:hypothetical protein [Chitinibacter sp. GC72]